MKIPVLRCRTAVSAVALAALLATCSAAAFLPHNATFSQSVTDNQVVVLEHTPMLASRSGDSSDSSISSQSLFSTVTDRVTVVESTSATAARTEKAPTPLIDTVAPSTLVLEEEAEVDSYGMVLDNIPMYQEADEESEVLCYLAAGALVTLRSPAGETWYQVSFDGVVGYVFASQITEELDEETVLQRTSDYQDYSDLYGMATTNLRLRDIPSRDGETLGMVVTGQVVQLLSNENGWYYVDANGTLGYVLEDGMTWGEDKPAWALEREAAEAEAAAQAAKEAEVTDLLALAESFLDTPYVYGASGTSSFDCSGYTSYLYGQFGYSLPHNAAQQLTTCGTAVSQDQLQPGDLVFFKQGTTRAASHVGMYIGDRQFIHASSGTGCVTISSLDDSWYARYYVGAKRILE